MNDRERALFELGSALRAQSYHFVTTTPDTHREGLALRIVHEAVARLAPAGTLILYTGAAVVSGRDTFLSAVTPVLNEAGLGFEYEELDPDVFGEELLAPGYEQVERIAAVGLRARCGG